MQATLNANAAASPNIRKKTWRTSHKRKIKLFCTQESIHSRNVSYVRRGGCLQTAIWSGAGTWTVITGLSTCLSRSTLRLGKATSSHPPDHRSITVRTSFAVLIQGALTTCRAAQWVPPDNTKHMIHIPHQDFFFHFSTLLSPSQYLPFLAPVPSQINIPPR